MGARRGEGYFTGRGPGVGFRIKKCDAPKNGATIVKSAALRVELLYFIPVGITSQVKKSFVRPDRNRVMGGCKFKKKGGGAKNLTDSFLPLQGARGGGGEKHQLPIANLHKGFGKLQERRLQTVRLT